MVESVDVFGEIAGDYHYSFQNNSSARLARSRLHRVFFKYLKADRGVVLDIGCGTGIDAQFIASLGCKVYGIDSSVGMLSEAARQLFNAPHDIRERVELELLEATPRSLEYLLPSIQANQVILSFGVVNFIENICDLFSIIGSNMGHKGILIVTSLSKSSWWERVIKRGQKRTGNQPKDVFVANVKTRAWFWDYNDIIAASRPYFYPVESIGIGAIYPPPYFDDLVRKFPYIQKLLWRIDRKFENSKLSKKYSDHVVVVLKRG